MSCYQLTIENSTSVQSQHDHSFVGGVPRLPAVVPLPKCGLCKSIQSFFFQLAFPDDVLWGGKTLAVFACTSCADKKYLIPEILEHLPLRNAQIPSGFLKDYQRNFRFLVSDTSRGIMRQDYEERIVFRRLLMRRHDTNVSCPLKIGGNPDWIMEDEQPGRYAGTTPMAFLTQIPIDLDFEILEDAPRQIKVGWREGKPTPGSERLYRLFIGNATYLFGTVSGEPLVYAITQID